MQPTLPGLDRAPSPPATPLPPNLLLGTSSWSSKDWYEVFYPRGLPPADFISFYATKFPTVEIDATFYATPSKRTILGWRDRTPAGFKFAAKLPQTITHEKVLEDCADELRVFLASMELLDDRLGPLLIQLPYFKKADFPDTESFLARLRPFLAALPSGFQFALEVRNKAWIGQPLLDLLREHKVAFAQIDHPYVPRAKHLLATLDLVTAPLVYIRLLGDRYGIERITKTWDKPILDRSRELAEWAEVVRGFVTLDVPVHVYANNHYAGHAPDTLRRLRECFVGEEGM